jgi:hypothetical protein
VIDAPHLFVARRPPTFTHFRKQRVRQAYDEFARPTRLVAALAIMPLLAFAVVRRAWRAIALATGMSLLVAETGRRRNGGRHRLPARAVLFTPLWLLERGVCTWPAVAHRARGGCPYAGCRLRTAANSRRTLRHLRSERCTTSSAA